jgi:hypothetical protein
MKFSFACLVIAIALRLVLDLVTAQEVVIQKSEVGGRKSVADSPHRRFADSPIRPVAISERELALFRPWDGTPWLTIARHGDNAWHPSFVNILVDYKPIVRKVGNQYEITFTSEIAEDIP